MSGREDLTRVLSDRGQLSPLSLMTDCLAAVFANQRLCTAARLLAILVRVAT